LIENILNDNQSGSFTITLDTLNLYSSILEESKNDSRAIGDLYKQLQSISKSLIKQQPNMVLLRKSSTNFLLYFKRLINSDKAAEEIYETLENRLDSIIRGLNENMDKIAQSGARIIANTNKIMTYSNSTLVRKILLTAHSQKRKFEVFCLKSHPPDEGVAIAEFLSGHGIKTTLIADSEVGIFMPEMNLVLVGADRLFDEGFVNKAGTLPLCLTARSFNIPVYLAAETSKILPEEDRAIKNLEYPGDEIYNGPGKNLIVKNIYYEKIPLNLVHKIVCEDSVFEMHEFVNWYLKE